MPAPKFRRRLRALLCLAASIAIASAASAAAPAKPETGTPLPPQPTVKLGAGMHIITAEVADNDATRMQGLMFRRSLDPNHGMVFVFDQHAAHCMWMRNTLLPLSVAFIADDGTIVNIEDMRPQTDDSHCARKPVRYALEMSKDWFSQHGIRAGQALRGFSQR